MFGKILFIRCKDSLLNFTHLIKIFILCKALHGFRHTPYKVIMLQSINICLLETCNHLKILLIKQFSKLLFTDCHQKLPERQGIQL